MAERTLIVVAGDTEDVASGLRVFRDALPSDATRITAIISRLFSISSLLTRLDRASQHPQYRPSFHRIRQPMSLVLLSLQATHDTAFDMFGRTRSLSHHRVWDDLQHQMEGEEGAALDDRLEWYSMLLESSIDDLQERPVRVNRRELCEQLSELLHAQNGSVERPRRDSVPLAFRYVEPRSPTFSFDDDRPAFPYAPDPPLSPTFTTTSSQTLESSRTSYSDVVSPHWAQHIFDGSYPGTPFQRGYDMPEATRCCGTPKPDALHRLAEEGFQRALELQFDGETAWIRLYHRPSDGRARILFMKNRTTFYCIQLAQLKAIRRRSSIWLCRVRSNGRLDLWANLNFGHYERMVLFYCTFVAMKRQDSTESIERQLREVEELKEKVLFHGEIQHGEMLHELKLCQDLASGVIRLEASPLRGAMVGVPLWTAFITKYKQQGDQDWAHLQSRRIVTLVALKPKPFVFNPGYTPLRRGHEWVLNFTSPADAEDFMTIWIRLCRSAN